MNKQIIIIKVSEKDSKSYTEKYEDYYIYCKTRNYETSRGNFK